MNLKLFIARFYLPLSSRKAGLIELYKITAQAFGCALDFSVLPRDYPALLKNYAEFTRDQADTVLFRQGLTDTVKTRLFSGAYTLGTKLRRDYRVKNYADFCRALRLVYKTIHIDLSCRPKREVTIRRCFFRNYYTGRICQLISSLDSGLVAGLSNGLKLVFYQRLTEDAPGCAARIFG